MLKGRTYGNGVRQLLRLMSAVQQRTVGILEHLRHKKVCRFTVASLILCQQPNAVSVLIT